MEVKLASQKWRQLQNLISQGSEAFTNVINIDMALLGVLDSTDKIHPKQLNSSSEESPKDQQTMLQLPILSGILRNTDVNGRTHAAAVIDGHRLKVNDTIRGFKLRKILKDGVIVTSNGRYWFLNAPNVAYSRVHSASAEGDDSK